MSSPTFVTSYEVLGTTSTLSLATPSFTPADGEVIIVKAASENLDKPSITGVSGGGLSYTSHAHVSQASHCVVRLWSATVGTSPGSMTVTTTFAANDGFHSMVVERWSGAVIAGSPAVLSTVTTGAPSVNLVTAADGSAISWVNGDWNANAPGTPAYRSGAIQTGIHDQSPNFYVAYFAYQATTTAGSQTVGLSSPGSQEASIAGIEIQGAGPSAPTVTTQAVTNLTATTATGNGTVVADGGDTITERGVCWGTSLNPTTSDSKATAAGTTGSYNVSITGLTNGTLYHARAYAINSVDTSYGADVTFQPYAIDIAWWSA